MHANDKNLFGFWNLISRDCEVLTENHQADAVSIIFSIFNEEMKNCKTNKIYKNLLKDKLKNTTIKFIWSFLSGSDVSIKNFYINGGVLKKILDQPNSWWGYGAGSVNADIARWLEECRTEHRADLTPNRRPPPEPVAQTPAPPPADIDTKHYKILLVEHEWFNPVIQAQFPALAVSSVSKRFNFASVSRAKDVSEDAFQSALREVCARTGGRAVPDFCYTLEGGSSGFDPGFREAPSWEDWDESEAWFELNDVLDRIKTGQRRDNYWNERVVIAIVDTGVNGERAEFRSPNKMMNGWSPPQYVPWEDEDGHGTMCAVIAAGTAAEGGRFRGVAPHARLLSCRAPDFADAHLVAIYDELLIPLAQSGHTVIATHSFGYGRNLNPQTDGRFAEFAQMIDPALEAGIHLVFSAGNYHLDVGGAPDACAPNSIWRFKGRADVLTVGTCDMEDRMWDYSSRGPGQFSGRAGHGPKPDVVAPTPKNGLIAHGARDMVAPNGWGTSGAAPQVAGLLALLLSAHPDLPRGELYDIVRQTARKLPGLGPTCQGHGMIDCDAALEQASLWDMERKRRKIGD